MNEKRIEDLESRFGAVALLREAGLPQDRIREVTTGRSVAWEDLSDEELSAVTEAAPDRVAGARWEDLSDAQLKRIADGEDPQKVVDT